MNKMNEKKHSIYFDRAVKVAEQSLCKRSQCGSIIVKNGTIIGQGYNGPPQNNTCNSRCLREHEIKPGFKSDKTCCVHAEQRAILDAVARYPNNINGARIYFVRLNDTGELEPAGQPYCTICSKLALDSGLAEFILWHESGVKYYDTKEYNDLSYAYNGG